MVDFGEMRNETIQQHSINLEPQKESVKIIKNVKSYTWEVKGIATGEGGLYTDEDFERILKLESKIQKEYGGEV